MVAGWARQREILLHSLSTNETGASETVQYSVTSGPQYIGSVQKPLSRGFVEITSTDPFASPALDYRTISNPVDLDVVIDAFRFARKVIYRPELAPLESVESAPGDEIAGDDDAKKEWARANMISTIAHSAGTTAMGKRGLGGCCRCKAEGVWSDGFESGGCRDHTDYSSNAFE